MFFTPRPAPRPALRLAATVALGGTLLAGCTAGGPKTEAVAFLERGCAAGDAAACTAAQRLRTQLRAQGG